MIRVVLAKLPTLFYHFGINLCHHMITTVVGLPYLDDNTSGSLHESPIEEPMLCTLLPQGHIELSGTLITEDHANETLATDGVDKCVE